MNAPVNHTIGDRVRAARLIAGLSLKHVVEQMRDPITVQQLANYETGKSRWPVDLLIEIARILKFPIGEVCGSSKTVSCTCTRNYRCLNCEIAMDKAIKERKDGN